jgi:hypothetical protein
MDSYRREISGYIVALQLLCLIFGSNGEAIAESDAEIARQYRELGRPMREVQVRALSDDKKRLIIAFLRREIESRRRQGDPAFTLEPIILNMAILGDDWAITEAASSFLAKGTRKDPSEMLLLKCPKAIPLMGEALFKDEQFELIGDVGYMPTQTTVANVILHTLSNSESFNEDVIDWARTVKDRYTIEMMRGWYRDNETKLKAWDFKAVQPGSEPPKGKHTSSVEIQPTTPPITAPPPDSATKVSATLATTDSSGVGIYWILVPGLAVFVGSIWLLARKSK